LKRLLAPVIRHTYTHCNACVNKHMPPHGMLPVVHLACHSSSMNVTRPLHACMHLLAAKDNTPLPTQYRAGSTGHTKITAHNNSHATVTRVDEGVQELLSSHTERQQGRHHLQPHSSRETQTHLLPLWRCVSWLLVVPLCANTSTCCAPYTNTLRHAADALQAGRQAD
jgi:hypothetical protein